MTFAHIVGGEAEKNPVFNDRQLFLSAVKLDFFHRDRLIKPASFVEIAEKSTLSLEKVTEIAGQLVEMNKAKCDQGYLLELDSSAFKIFGLKNNPEAKKIVKEARKEAYQNSDKPRKPRQPVKNNPELICKTGNRCGHNPSIVPVFELPKNSKKRPPSIAYIFKKLCNYFLNPKNTLPDLNNARKNRKKNGTYRQQRSERREALVLLLSAILATLDLLTMRVGCPVSDDEFTGIKLESLAEKAGITFTRAERAMHDLVAAGLIGVVQKCEKNQDGTYTGYAAVRLVSPKLFEAFGLLDELSENRNKLAKKVAKKANAGMNVVAEFIKDAQEAAACAAKAIQEGTGASAKDTGRAALRAFRDSVKV